jgi:hypothetical protein
MGIEVVGIVSGDRAGADVVIMSMTGSCKSRDSFGKMVGGCWSVVIGTLASLGSSLTSQH